MTTPTIAIGIGQAGCRMLDTLAETVDRIGEIDDFSFVAFDTNAEDIYSQTPDQVSPFELDRPVDNSEFWERDRRAYRYLTPEYDLDSAQGVTRQRAVARYHVDEHYGDIYRFLETEFERFVDRRVERVGEDVPEVKIWILNSLGGGTGSGSFPLIAAAVKDITSNMNEQFTIEGLGSLSRLDHLDNGRMPDANPEYFVNTYAALRELRALTNHDDDPDRYPLRVHVESNHDLFPDDYIELEESPFSRYWLLGFDEEEDGPRYRSRINAIAAYVIYYVSAKKENFPDDDDLRDVLLYSVTGVEVSAPIERMHRYIDLEDELRELEEEIADHERRLEEINRAIEYLERVLSLDVSYDELPTDPAPVDAELVRKCRTRAAGFNAAEVNDEEFTLDDTIEAVAETVEEHVPGEMSFDTDQVIVRFFCALLAESLEQERVDHDFRDRVERAWNRHAGEIKEDEKFGFLEEEPPRSKWENGLEAYLREKGKAKVSQADQSLNPFKKRRLRQEAEEIKSEIQTLRRLHGEYEALDDIAEEARSRAQSARNSLKRRKQDLDDEREDLRSGRTSKRNQLQTRKRERSRRAKELADFRTTQHGTDLPVRDPEKLEKELFQDATSIASLADAELISEADVGRALANCLANDWVVENPIEDAPNIKKKDSSTTSLAVVLTHDENVNRRNLLEIELEDQQDLDQQFDRSFDRGLMGTESIADGFSIWLLSMFADMELRNTSEYATMDELFADDDRSVGDRLGSFSDEDVAARFAYPELVDDRKVNQHFAGAPSTE